MGFLGDLGVSRVPSGRGSSGEALFFWAVGQFVGVDEVDPQDRDILVEVADDDTGRVKISFQSQSQILACLLAQCQNQHPTLWWHCTEYPFT
jgi:hypothetical protein